jgi:hypothetical protein
MTESPQGKKFPLLVYRRWAKMLRLPSLLVVVASGVAWWYAPQNELVENNDWLFLVIAAVMGVVFVYSLLAGRSYVQCLSNYVRVRTPFLSVAIAYQRILQARPITFRSQLELSKMKSPRRRMVQPFLGHTALLLELRGFPVSERRLRTWLPWFMFATEVTGLVLVVEDWMALSQQITTFSDRAIARRQARQRPQIGLRR